MWPGRIDRDDPRLTWALDVLVAYRAAHQYPLVKASNGLRSTLRTEQVAGQVSQRLKRVPTIWEKLLREPTMQLAGMQDIGGCRAVVTSLAELRAAERRLRKNRPAVRVSDYTSCPPLPRATGLSISSSCTRTETGSGGLSRCNCAPR